MSAPSRVPLPPIEQTEGVRPLGRRATRVFVLLALLVMVGSAVGMAVYFTRAAKENRAQMGTENDNRSDVPGFGVTNAGDK